MTRFHLFLVIFLLITQAVAAREHPGINRKNNHAPVLASSGSPANGITIAGGSRGSGSNQLDGPSGVHIDGSGNIYIADKQNARIQQNAIGSSIGFTVAGGNGIGSAANQLNNPVSVSVDGSGNQYIVDQGNSRIQRWTYRSKTGTTVAGGNGAGSAANQLSLPSDVFIAPSGNVYVADRNNHRIQKWMPGSSQGITVAGGNGAGSASNQLDEPGGVFVDEAETVYVSDTRNHRIQKWAPGSTTGITVAGGNGAGSSQNQLDMPADLYVDPRANIYIADFNNFRIQKWSANATLGVTLAGGNGAGSAQNQFASPTGLYLDRQANVYVSDQDNDRVQKFAATNFPGSPVDGITVAGGNGSGNASNQLSQPFDVFVDAKQNVYVSDTYNSRVQKWAPGASAGVTVAGGNGYGFTADKLSYIKGVFVDAGGNVYVSDNDLHRIQKWAPGATSGVTVAGGNGSGSAANQLSLPHGIFVDAAGNLYVADFYNYRIQRWAPGAKAGVTVAGGNGFGSADNQFKYVTDVFVDGNGAVYVNDQFNFRIQKWLPGALSGITVAGGNGQGSAPDQFMDPFTIFVDGSGNIYASDSYNQRIQKWAPGATSGITVAGGNGRGSLSNQFNSPLGVFVDATGNLYVTDAGNNRVQKFGLSGLTYKYYEGSFSTLPDFSELTPVKSGTSPNVDIAVRPPAQDNNFAFVWDGFINIPAAGNYTFETVSDDGSKLYFNSHYYLAAIPTVSNDGLHAPASASGTVYVSRPGVYPISMTFFEKDGGETMQVYWSGPGIPRQPIPDAAFTTLYNKDSIPPSAPANLHVVSKGVNAINLAWEPASDNIGVIAYEVYINGLKKLITAELKITADSLLPNTSYTFVVKAIDLAGNMSGLSNTVDEATAGDITKNLTYKYYEGTWDKLPDFSGLNPLRTGPASKIDINVRTPGIEEHFGVLWEGSIYIPVPGTYTFSTISDDGSALYFNTSYSASSTPLVNNDGLHPYVPAWGTTYLPSAGCYPIAIAYFNKTGDKGISVNWSGPGFDEQPVPDAAFSCGSIVDLVSPTTPVNLKATAAGNNFINLAWDAASDNVGVTGYDVYVNGVKQYTVSASTISVIHLAANASYTFTLIAFDSAGNRSPLSAPVTATTTAISEGGLNYHVYQGEWNYLPDFSLLTSIKSGNAANVDISVRPPGMEENFGIVWEGYINIPAPGTYTFTTISDDGSMLYFNNNYSSGTAPLVNNDGLHAYVQSTGTVNVASAGRYPFAVTFFNKTGDKGLSLFWSGPDFSHQVIPDAAFSLAAPFVVANTETRNAILETAKDLKETGKVYPVPFTDKLNIDFYNDAPGNEFTFTIRDLTGRPLYTRKAGKFGKGHQTFQIALNGWQLSDGTYLVTIQVNSTIYKTIKAVKFRR